LKGTVTYKNGKVKNIDFASTTSKLLHDGVLLWKTNKGKLVGNVTYLTYLFNTKG